MDHRPREAICWGAMSLGLLFSKSIEITNVLGTLGCCISKDKANVVVEWTPFLRQLVNP
jgi:hypothetical protein